MFDKKTLLVGLLSFATVLGIQVLFRQWFAAPTSELSVQTGGSYTIPLPSATDLARPAQKNLSFDEAVAAHDAHMLTVSTSLYEATFTTVGGTLDSLMLLPVPAIADRAMPLVVPAAVPDHASYIVACDEHSPLHYRLDEHTKQSDGSQVVRFSARYHDWQISKTFTLYPDTYRIELTLAFKTSARHPAPLRPRLFVAAPRSADATKDKPTAVVFDAAKGALNTDISDVQRTTDAWVQPSIIGGQTLYCAQVLYADTQGFVQRGYFTAADAGSVSAILEGPTLTDAAAYTLSFYAGPKNLETLAAVDERLEGLLNFGFLSWLVKWLLRLLDHIYDLVHNYGIAIMLLTMLLRLLLMPFSLRGMKYMEQQQRLQPRVAGLRKKYAHDTAMFNAELMKLYQEHGVSPAGPLIGCLFMLPQWPIFFAMYRLAGAVQLHHAPFFGWITDLSAKDPYYVLPALVIALTFMQPFSMGGEEGDSRTRMMRFVMPLLLSAMFVGMPAVVLLFLVVNFSFSLFEQRIRALLSRRGARA